jgi:hypothetical protein
MPVNVVIPESVIQSFPLQERDSLRKLVELISAAVDTSVGSLTLDDLADVSAASPTDTQVLTYDSGDDLWEAANGGGGGSSTLAGLSDVNIPSPTDGDFLRYNQSTDKWVANTTALNDLSDVTITSVGTRDEIEWNGSAWVNKSPFPQLVTEATTSRTSLLTDAGSYVRFTNGSATTYTIAPQSSVAWRDGAQIELEQGGAGAVTIQGGSGVTIRVNSALTAVTNGQYAVAGLKRVAANEWVLFGNLVAA